MSTSFNESLLLNNDDEVDLRLFKYSRNHACSSTGKKSCKPNKK